MRQPLKPHRATAKSAFAEKIAHEAENTPNVRKSAFAAGGKKATKAIAKKRAAARKRRPQEEPLVEQSALEVSMDLEVDMEESFVVEEKASKRKGAARKSSLSDEEVTSHELYVSLQKRYDYLQSLRETKMEQLYNKLQEDIVAKNEGTSSSPPYILSLRCVCRALVCTIPPPSVAAAQQPYL